MDLKAVFSFALVGITLILGLLVLLQKPTITGDISNALINENDESGTFEVEKKCIVRCYSSEDCDDFKEETTDICKYRGHCNSTCKHYTINFIGSIA